MKSCEPKENDVPGRAEAKVKHSGNLNTLRITEKVT